MYPSQGLEVGVFDTTESKQRDELNGLLHRNGDSISVESIHTAATGSGCVAYHWVTVIYRIIR